MNNMNIKKRNLKDKGQSRCRYSGYKFLLFYSMFVISHSLI